MKYIISEHFIKYVHYEHFATLQICSLQMPHYVNKKYNPGSIKVL